MIRKFFTIAALPFFMWTNVHATNCAEDLATRSKTDLALPFETFDQTQESGWRPLAKAECYLEAAELIKQYIALHPHSDPILHWHLAQSLALGGNLPEAIKVGKKYSLRPEKEARLAGFRNELALATIAQWEGDKKEFLRQKELIQSSMLKEPNAPDAEASKRFYKALTRLEGCFTLPYVKAVKCKAEP